MATDFWASSHHKRWQVDRATLRQARTDDLHYVGDPEMIDFFYIFFANLISKLGKQLQLRQRVIATATVFFLRFYLKNSICDTDPYIVIAACCYVAAKAEEAPVHIKNVVAEARSVFSQEPYNMKSFPTDNSKLAEMEFYLVDDLECDLTVFHPYRTLMALCSSSSSSSGVEAGELGVGIGAEEGERYWGTGEGRLELGERALQTAWLIINDTYRSPLPLLHPPHLIAIAAIYLTLIYNSDMRASLSLPSSLATAASTSTPIKPPSSARRSARHGAPKKQDAVAFLAGLNVSLERVAALAQEIIALYALCERYRDEQPATFGRRAQEERAGEGAGGVTAGTMARLLFQMRKERLEDLMHPPSGRPMVVNRMLERTG